MKRLLSTLLLCLFASTAALLAQQRYSLTLKTSPQGMANYTIMARNTFGFHFQRGSQYQILEGDNVDVSISDVPSGWKVTEWRVTEGNATITTNGWNNTGAYFPMPAENIVLTAMLEYNPDNPENPMPNAWYPDEGKLVIDFIDDKYFSSELSRLVPEEDYARITSIVVSGRLNDSDLLSRLDAEQFPSLTYVDISRTDYDHMYIGEVENRPLQQLFLPACVTSFGDRAFEGTYLTELTLYATTPPRLAHNGIWNDELQEYVYHQNVFPNTDFTVYVPEEALPLYKADEDWKQFDLQPIVEDAANLKVSIEAPNGDMTPYFGMTLQTRNVKSLATRSQIIGSRKDYTFTTLPKHTSYDVKLLSRTGAVVAEARDVLLDDEDASVSLTGLRRPCTLKLNVSDGTSYLKADQYDCLWLSSDGRTLMRGNRIENILEDETVQALIVLTDPALKAAYKERDTIEVTPKIQGDATLLNIDHQLKAIPTHRITALVKRADGQYIGNNTATVTIHRTATGEQALRQQFNTLSDNGLLTSGQLDPLPEGEYEVTVSVENTNLTTQTQHLSLNADQTITFSLNQAEGSTVSIKWRHYGVAAQGLEADDADYSVKHLSDASITLRDLTNGRNITEWAVSPTGSLRLQERLEPNTEVELTLGNVTSSSFAPAVIKAKADSEGNLTYDVVTRDYGTLLTSFTSADCSRVSVRVYDAQGKLVSASNAVTTVKEFTLLPDGTYTVLLMEAGTMANAMSTLDDVNKFLTQNNDYVSAEVNVAAGTTAVAPFTTVPAFTGSSHLYTEESATRVTPKKPIINMGTFQTLTTRVVFRPEYKGRISDIKVRYTLPDDNVMRFVEGSALIGNDKTSYELSGRELTVPTVENSLLRFCLVPHTAGEHSISGRLTFLLDGTPTEQPLPAASFTVNEADIFVSTVTASEDIEVSGTALAQTPITVYVNEQPAGTTTTNIYGEWHLKVHLAETYNMATNSIYAQFEGNDGYNIKTATKEVTYDKNAIMPLSVKMSHYNEYMKKEQTLVFDVQNNTVTPSSYSFYHDAEFTFDVTLNKTDSLYIDQVLLYVYMTGNQRRLLFPKFNPRTGHWVATDVFKADGLPSQVRVYVEEHAPKVLAEQDISDRVHYFDNAYEEYIAEDPELKKLLEDVESTTPGTAENDEAVRQMMIRSGIDPDEVKSGEKYPDTPEGKSQWESDLDQALASMDAAMSGYDKMKSDGYFEASNTPMNELGNVLGGFTFSKMSASTRQYCEARARGLQPKASHEAGPNETEYDLVMENGNHAYYRLHDNGYTLILPSEDLEITLDYSQLPEEIAAPARELSVALSRMAHLQQNAPFKSSDAFIDEVMSVCDKIGEAMSKVATELTELQKRLGAFVTAQKEVCIDEFTKIHKATSDSWNTYWKGHPDWQNDQKFIILKGKNAVALNKMQGLKKTMEYLDKAASALGTIGKVLNVVALIADGHDFLDIMYKVVELYESVPNPCKAEQAKADGIRNSIAGWGSARLVQKGYSFVNNAFSVAAAIAGVATAETGVGGLIGFAISGAISLANYAGNKIVDSYWNKWMKDWEKQINELKCDSVPCEKNKPLKFDNEAGLGSAGASSGTSGSGGKGGKGGCGGDEDCNKARNTKKGDSPGGCPGPPPPPPPGGTPIMDPSGYIFEAVASNRVADALATVYYKDIYEDMYGDEHERAVIWDAEKFNQINPMLTDKNGEYGWDVPGGMWQVRVVKDGYLDTQSEWLPVPPPQLDVNLEMVQPTAPVVSRVVATEQGVELGFDKYMKPKLLTADNIFVTRNNQKLEGEILLLDEEVTPDSLKTFASRVRFVPAQPLKLNEKVRLTVKAQVESYANVPMTEDFTQEFDVENRVAQIVTDSIVGMLYESNMPLTVAALPAEAAKGKKVIIESLNGEIVGVAATELTLDANGQGTVNISGKGYGTTAVKITLADDSEVTAYARVSVKDADNMLARKPTASRISGTEVDYGTTVSLTCETPGATIYYTLDGSCPCDNPDRIRYEMPITIVANTTIKAIAIAPGYAESDVATFTFTLKKDPNSIESVITTDNVDAVYTVEGIKVKADSNMHKGLYIYKGRKVVVK